MNLSLKIDRILTPKIANLLAIILCILFSLAGILVSLHRFWQYGVNYFDFGIFDQAIWSASRLKSPIIDHFIVSGKWIFADHLSPSIFLLSPFYWLTSRSEILLVIQATVVGLSGFVLYKIGQFVLKNNFLAFTVLISYFLFVGLQNAVITEFHELTILTLPLALTFWTIIRKKKVLYFIFFLILLGMKETTFIIGIVLGITIFFIRAEWVKIAIFTILIAILWGFVSIKLVIPYFSGGYYIYSSDIPNGTWEKLAAIANHPLKRQTLLYSFASFGFLPILAPEFWLMIYQDYFVRFLGRFCCTRWDLGLHYNASSAVILAMSSIYAWKRVIKIKQLSRIKNFLAITNIVIAFTLFRFILHGPFLLAINPAFYMHSNDFEFLNVLIEKVPKNASVMTHNNLLPRFTHQKVWILRLNYGAYNPDYIVIDSRKGQNPNDFFATGEIEPILEKLKKDPHYKIIYQTTEQFVFKK